MIVKYSQKEDVISLVISDFIKTCRLYKEDSVFFISFLDTVHGLTLKRTENTYVWVRDTIYEDLIAVSISGGRSKWLYGQFSKLPPIQYIEKNDRLFYWLEDYPSSDEILNVLQKYDMLQYDEGGWIKMPDAVIDDSKKGADYYFCRNNILKYKKIITSKGTGYYKPPKVKCN
ncbi:hypothetical protein D0T85_06120 [Bacteroides sp. 519]|nr:hypothetical protein [Bacteroides sp. 519]